MGLRTRIAEPYVHSAVGFSLENSDEHNALDVVRATRRNRLVTLYAPDQLGEGDLIAVEIGDLRDLCEVATRRSAKQQLP